MKALFLGVCLLNIVFLFWEYHKGALNPSPKPQTLLPTIMLADDLERARRGTAISAYLDRDLPTWRQLRIGLLADKPKPIVLSAKPKAAAAKTPSTACYEIGPFADQPAAGAWLAGQTLRGELIYKEVLTPSAYLVYYPAAKNPEQMRIQKMMLNAKGINDIWVIPSGDLKGALSLGLFNEQSRAVLFKNQLLQRGVQAEIKERYKPQSRPFLRIRGDQKIRQRLAEGLTQAGCGKP